VIHTGVAKHGVGAIVLPSGAGVRQQVFDADLLYPLPVRRLAEVVPQKLREPKTISASVRRFSSTRRNNVTEVMGFDTLAMWNK